MVVPCVSPPAVLSEGTRQGLGVTAVPGNAPAPAAAPLAEEEEEEEQGGCPTAQHWRLQSNLPSLQELLTQDLTP